jgi:hypothetical protein
MNSSLEEAGFTEFETGGLVCLDLGTLASPFLVFANQGTPQFLFGVEGEVDQSILKAVFAVLDAIDVSSQEAASAFAVPATIPPFDTLGFVRGPGRRLLRGILEDEAALQVFPMHACELTAEGQLPPLDSFRRWTNLFSLSRRPQPWFHFRMHGPSSGLNVPKWGTEAYTTLGGFVQVLSGGDAAAWLEVRNREGVVLRLPDADGWLGAREKIDAHVCGGQAA